MIIETGGAAFPETHVPPRVIKGERIETGWKGRSGMFLRDYFVAKAMQAIIGDAEGVPTFARLNRSMDMPDATNADIIANNAYFMADAMLKERSKCQSPPS